MKCTAAALLLLLVAVCQAGTVPNTISSVISQVQTIKEQAAVEAREEADTFEKFLEHAQKEKAKLAATVKGSEEKLADLKDAAKADQQKAKILEEEINKTAAEIDQHVTANAEALKERQEEIELYQQQMNDTNDTIVALKAAIANLTAAGKGVTGDALIQARRTVAKSLIGMPQAMKELDPDEETLVLALAAAEKVSKPEITEASDTTSSVTDLLKKLLMDFEDKAQSLKMAEVQANSTYSLAKGGRDEQIRIGTVAKVKKETALGLVNASLATNKEDTESTQADLDADSKTLMDVTNTIKVKKSQFKEREYMRDRESHELQTAINVLSDAVGEKTGLIQVKWHAHAVKTAEPAASTVSLAKARTEPEVHPLAEAGKSVDQAIEKQVWKVHDDKMKVEEEKQWCAAELSKTKLEKQGKEDAIQELKDQIDSTSASIAALIQEIAEATKIITDAKSDMHDAKMDREKERHDNQVTVDEAVTSQDALRKGAAALEKFYKDAGATAEASADTAVQGLSEDAPAVGFTESTFTGSSASSSVVELLENSADEYAKLEVETKAIEAASQKSFEDEMKDMKTSIAKRETEVELKTAEKSRMTEKLEQAKGDVKLTDRQHASIARYLKDVEERCDVNFTAQLAAHDAELADLNESKATIEEAFAPPEGQALLAKKSSLRFLQPLKLFGA